MQSNDRQTTLIAAEMKTIRWWRCALSKAVGDQSAVLGRIRLYASNYGSRRLDGETQHHGAQKVICRVRQIASPFIHRDVVRETFLVDPPRGTQEIAHAGPSSGDGAKSTVSIPAPALTATTIDVNRNLIVRVSPLC
jgi:hypothetical protein